MAPPDPVELSMSHPSTSCTLCYLCEQGVLPDPPTHTLQPGYTWCPPLPQVTLDTPMLHTTFSELVPT